MTRYSLVGLIAVALTAAIAAPAEAFGRRCRSSCYSCCYTCYPCCDCCPCWPCCPPDETPLNPPPPHPVPQTTLKHTLTLLNGTRSDAFVVIYIRHADCCYRVYDKAFVKAGTSIPAPQPNGYFAGDHLLIETWSRGDATVPWQCRCKHLVFLNGAASTFNVISCQHLYPKSGESTQSAAPATIVVDLPADADLTFDNLPTASTSGQRLFVTPPLASGQSFSYAVTARMVRNGETHTVNREVVVRAGEETRVRIEDVTGVAVAAK